MSMRDVVVGENKSFPKRKTYSWSERTANHSGTETTPELIVRQQWGILDKGRKLDPANATWVMEGNDF